MRLPLQTSTLNAYTRACMKGCVAFPIVQIIAAQSPSPPAFLKLLTPQLTLESRLALDRLVPLMTSTETQFESIHQAVLTYLFCLASEDTAAVPTSLTTPSSSPKTLMNQALCLLCLIDSPDPAQPYYFCAPNTITRLCAMMQLAMHAITFAAAKRTLNGLSPGLPVRLYDGELTCFISPYSLLRAP